MRTSIVLPLLLGSSLAAPGWAQSFALEVDPLTSSVSMTNSYGVFLPGVAIGDHDPADNPEGTRTLPGLFGGSGNQPVSMDLGLSGDTDHSSLPLGGLVLEVDTTLLSVRAREFELDLLGGGTAETLLSLTLEFETFRTFAPDSVFIGGFPITLPLGAQTLSDLVLVQDGPSTLGTLTQEPAPGHYSFALLVPAQLSFAVDFGGQAFPVGPLAVALPLAGELTIAGDNAEARVAFDLALAQQIDDPLPGFSIDGVPLPLPTVLPPGSTANLLFSAVIGSLDVSLAAGLILEARGSAPCGFESYCASQPNTSGEVAELIVQGSPYPADRSLSFHASGLPSKQFGLLVTSQGDFYGPFYNGHQGHLCLNPPLTRLHQQTLIFGPDGTASLELDFDALPPHVTPLPGSTWHFQLWYRDQQREAVWNSTNAVRTRFCTVP